MKRMLVLLLVCMLALPVLAAADTLKVGMEANYAPYNWTQSQPSDSAVPLSGGGYADGYDVQIAKIIAKELGLDLEIVKTEWDGLPPALTSGKIDAIVAGMSPTKERMMVLDFTDSYYESDLVMVVKKDSIYATAKELKEFAGARITGQLNTFHYGVIDQIENVDKLTAMETFPAMIVALDSGRIDGYVSERPGAVSAIASNPDFTFVAFEEGKGFIADPADTTIAVALQKGSPLLAKINEILKGIDKETRLALMDEAILNQPISQ
ncbi:MAG: transporter substrate-binding domain-containing protein [Eubacteriales bacterium]|nr:transporter substrate-binding domain-containing protein [Eubacteriales bacterium]MDD4105051.1 transporter substrate-binding domain-containing protein [Eubacteriales bacterium]MDD4709914.1 transporter substrate-binding domain-containing protein [Eubacteriales bacterium]NLO15308.1 transporter substrate-binding domain-containing protein [Clostridiales bacterium]